MDKQLLTIVSQFAVKIINKRINGEQKNPKRDILARLLEVNQQDASQLTLSEIIALTTTNLIAGSDSTAIALRAIFYFLARNSVCYSKL